MNSTESSFKPVQTPRNILWVDTYYFIVPYTISNMNTRITWKSQQYKPKYYDLYFEFQFTRINDQEFSLTCIRLPSSPASSIHGFNVEFHCSARPFDQETMVIVMEAGKSQAFDKFCLNASYRQNLSQQDLDKYFELKILVKMVEYDVSANNRHLHQEELFQNLKEQFFNSKSVLEDLGFILKYPAVRGLFSGYQNDDFAGWKCNFIKRTAVFSKEVASYFRAKDACIPVPLTDLGLILNYILNGQKAGSISNQDLIKLYFVAYATGLNYLVDLCRDCILGRTGNQSFAIEALQAAARVNDEDLFDKTAESFNHSLRDIVSSERFFEGLKQQSLQHRFMMYSLKRNLLKKDVSYYSVYWH